MRLICFQRSSAAVTIQKNYKGYKVRKAYKARKQEGEKQQVAVTDDTPTPKQSSRSQTPARDSQSQDGFKTPIADDNQPQSRTQTPARAASQSGDATQ